MIKFTNDNIDNKDNSNNILYSNNYENLNLDTNELILILLENFNKKLMLIADWKFVFKKIREILMYSNTENLLNVFLLLDKITKNIHYTDFELKTYFNDILSNIILYISNPNTLFSKLSKRIINSLIKEEENIEYLIKYVLINGLESNNFTIKLNSIIVLKMIFESNNQFFLKKSNYTKKIIVSLVNHSKDSSDKICNMSIEILKYFISFLPNYNTIIKSLSPDIIKEIEVIKTKEKTNVNDKSNNIINYSINIIENKFENKLSEDFSNYLLLNNKKIKNDKYDISEYNINGFYFMVFPQTIIEGLNSDLPIETRLSNFNTFKNISILNINTRNDSFLKYVSTFFDYILYNFLEDKVNSIVFSSLIIINSIISLTPGINLLINMFNCISKLLNCLSSNKLIIRNETKEIFYKIMMVLPSSILLSYFINKLDNSNWILVTECLDIILYLYKNLASIYNDIDYSLNEFDITPFIRILELFVHPIPKVRVNAKKIIKYVGENVINKIRFLKTLELIVSESLFKEIEKLFLLNKNMSKETSNFVDYFKDNVKVASCKVINEVKEDLLYSSKKFRIINNFDIKDETIEDSINIDTDTNYNLCEDKKNNNLV